MSAAVDGYRARERKRAAAGKPYISKIKVSNSTALAVGATDVTRAAAAAGTITVSQLKGLVPSTANDLDFVFRRSFKYVVITACGSASAASGTPLRHQVDCQLQDSSAAVPTFYSPSSASYEFGAPVSQPLVQGQSAALTSGDPEVATIFGSYIARNVTEGDLIKFSIEALVGAQVARNLDIYIYGYAT